MRWAVLLLLPIVATAAEPSGEATIRGKAGPSDIVVTTTNRLAGAIHSVTWNGKEFIDSGDHGRQLQSAAAFGRGEWKDFSAERYNPTEAGSARDGVGPRSTSRLLGLQAKRNELTTIVRPAFWLAPGERDQTNLPALNAAKLSDFLITKQVTIGYKHYAFAIDYRATFSVPPTERHTLGQFEAVTGYMPIEFSKFWTLDVRTGDVAPLSDGPGEQAKPVIFSTEDGRWAMGAWSPDQPAKGFEGTGYGRWRFPTAKVVKWNVVFRTEDRNGIATKNYTYRTFVAVGTMQNVRDTLFGLANEKEFAK